MKKMTEGSALLISMLMMSGLALTCLVCWRSTIFSMECMLEKQKYEIRYQLIRGLHDYGVWFFGTYLDEVLKKLNQNQEFTLQFSAWPTDKSPYHARLHFKQQDQNIVIAVKGLINEGNATIAKIHWLFIRQGDGIRFYVVDALSIN
jgi:hypothetical protein